MADEQRLTFRGAGLNLAADASGPDHGPPVLFLHGSGQTRQSWRKALHVGARRGFRAIALDLRGHGDSDWSPDGRYDLPLFTEDLRAVIGQVGEAPAVVGASLGGLAALLVAAAPPPRLGALVLVDITPRIEMKGAQEVIGFMGSAKDGFASLEEAADAVAAYLPHRDRPRDNSGLARNLRLRNGRYYWHWDPAFMQMGRDAEAKMRGPNRLEAAARAVTCPALLIRGGRSRIVTAEAVREFQQLVPHAEFIDIADAHHMVAGDANDAFNEAAFDFLDRVMAPAAA